MLTSLHRHVLPPQGPSTAFEADRGWNGGVALLAAYSAWIGWHLWFTPVGFDVPAYSTVEAIFPWKVWAVGFGLVALAGVMWFVFDHLRTQAWIIMISLGAVIYGTFWAGLTWRHFVIGDPISASGWANWGFISGTCVDRLRRGFRAVHVRR